MGGHVEFWANQRLLRLGDLGGNPLHTSLHSISIKITHDDDSLQLGLVPCVVEIADLIVLKGLEEIERAYHIALSVL